MKTRVQAFYIITASVLAMALGGAVCSSNSTDLVLFAVVWIIGAGVLYQSGYINKPCKFGAATQPPPPKRVSFNELSQVRSYNTTDSPDTVQPVTAQYTKASGARAPPRVRAHPGLQQPATPRPQYDVTTPLHVSDIVNREMEERGRISTPMDEFMSRETVAEIMVEDMTFPRDKYSRRVV